jgi:hypothetical protein
MENMRKLLSFHGIFRLFCIPIYSETSETIRFANWQNSATVKFFRKQWNVLQHTYYRKTTHEISLTALCPLYGLLPPLQPSIPLPMVLYPLYSLLSPFRPSVTSKAIFLLYGPLSPLVPSVICMVICLLCGLLSPLRPFVSSTANCPLFGPLPPIRPSVSSMALGLL